MSIGKKKLLVALDLLAKAVFIATPTAIIILNFLTVNKNELFDYVGLFLAAVSIFSCSAAFALAIRTFSSNEHIVTSYSVLVFFMYSTALRSIQLMMYRMGLGDLIKFTEVYFAIAWTLIFSAMVVVLIKLSSRKFFVVFSKYLLTTALISQSIAYYYNNSSIERSINVHSFGKLNKTPNVYFFVIDAYPHKDTIKELFEADDPLSQGLSSRGFVIAEKSFANYPFTPMSVSSQLMCEYYSDNENLAWSVIRGGKSNVVRTFMKNGYNIYLNVGKISNSASLHETLLNMLSQTILTSVVKLSHFVQYLEPIDIVQFIRDRNSGGSNFVYAHFFQVHDNAVTDERGKIVTHEFEMVLDDNRSHFMKSIKDFSQKFLALIDEIRLRDKSAVVLVNSDHGLPVFIGNDFSRKDFLFMKNARHGELIQLWFKTAICAIKKVKDGGMSDIWKYRQKNFVGVFVPVDSDNLKNSVKASEFANPISNINLFRVLFSHLGIKNLPKISDEVFVSTLAAKKGGHAEFKLIKAPYIRDSLYKNGNKNKK